MDPTPPQPPPSVLSSMATDDHSKDPEPIVETHISTRSTEVDAEAMKKAKRELVNRLLSARRLLAQPGYALHSIPEEEASGRMMESNVRELHQASSSPIRTEKDLTRRSEPYRSPGVGPAKRRNKKASKSTPPAMQPTGELISESTADPKTDRRIKEGDKPKSKRRHQQEQENEKELCDLVMRWKGLTNRPTKTETLALALEYLRETRVPLFPSHRLAEPKSHKKDGDALTPAAQKERDRRIEVRALHKELSRYYRPPGNRGMNKWWVVPSLLSKIVGDLRVRIPLSVPSTDESAP